MKLNQWAVVAGMGLALCLGANNGLAQQDNGGGGRGGRGGNFDPAQMRERMMEDMRDQLDVKDDAEWKAIQPLIEKVMDAQRQVMSERIRGFFGGGRGGGGRRGGDNTSAADDNGGRRFRGGQGGAFGGGEPSPEAEALQRAIDGKASAAELKAALAKFQDARKAKQDNLEKAQGDLRKVLSTRQEAVLALRGLL